MSVSRLFTQLFSAFFFNLKLRLEEICLFIERLHQFACSAEVKVFPLCCSDGHGIAEVFYIDFGVGSYLKLQKAHLTELLKWEKCVGFVSHGMAPLLLGK